ncbi:MAG: dockerin type I repeat-containing protein [Oscillospiraceae bacterium]|nr:dockerin type I repeat-containing protein [Candidatus Limimonas egerieequi]
MILTIVPLGLFVFAEDPVRETKTWHIKTLDDFNDIGNEEKNMLLSDNYILDNDIIPQTVTDKMIAWLASDEANQIAVSEKLAPLYSISFDESAAPDTDYYEKGAGDEYNKVEFTEGKQYEPNVYYVLEYVISTAESVVSGTDYYEKVAEGEYTKVEFTEGKQYEPNVYYVLEYVISTTESAVSGTNYYEKVADGEYTKVEFEPAKLYENGKYYKLVLAEGEKFTPSIFGSLLDDAYTKAYSTIQELSGVKDGDADPNTIEMISGAFTGTFNGQGYVIDQVELKQTTGIYCGLFENNKGTIENLILGNEFVIEFTPDVSMISLLHILLGSGVYAGGITAINAEGANVNNCDFNGFVIVDFAPYFTEDALSKAKDNILSAFYSLPLEAGGIAGANNGTIGDDCSTAYAYVGSNYFGGTGIKLGQKVGSDNDISMISVNRKVANFDNVPENQVVLKTEQLNEEDRYQLLKGTDAVGAYTFYYIRMIACEHLNIKDENHVLAVTPTCKTAGNIEYWTCPDCNQKFAGPEKPTIDSTSVLTVGLSKNRTNHDATTVKHTDAADPTCGADGNIEYWYCSTCNAYMIAATGAEDETVVTIEGVEGNFIEVDQSATVVKATGEHSATPFAANDPTYESDGNKAYWYCDECKQYFLEEACETPVDYDEDIVIPRLTIEVKDSSNYTKETVDSLSAIIASMPSSKDGLKLSDFIGNLKDGLEYVVRDAEGTEITDSDAIVPTNASVEIKDHPASAVKVIVRGDANGDGAVGIADYITIRKKIMETTTLDAIASIGADANGDGTVGIADYIAIKKLIMK